MEVSNLVFTPHFLQSTSTWLRTTAGYHALFMLEPAYRHQDNHERCLHMPPSTMKHVKRLLQRMYAVSHAQGLAYRSLLTALWQETLHVLCCTFSEDTSHSYQFTPLADTMAYIENNYAEDLTLDDMAARAHLSKNQFIRTFKKYYNSTPNTYVVQVRIAHAKEQLIKTQRSITDIAFANGFSDSNYFSRVFKQHEGCSPRQWRAALSS